jgi:ABC-type multidrug transport system permease subunit
MRETRIRALVELTRMRLLEFVREPEAVFWVFAFPIVLTCALGIAFRTQEPQPVPIGVQGGAGAAELLGTLAGQAEVLVREVPPAEVERALRNGSLHLVIVPGQPPTYRFDPTRPETRLARLAADQALQSAMGRRDAFAAHEDTVVPPGSRYIDWVLPGLIGMNIMGSSMWGLGFSIVMARVRKLLKRLIATPMRRFDYLAAQLAARLVFLVLEVGVTVGFGVLVFGTPVNGSLVSLSVICLLGALAFGGLGLLVASRARTIEAVSGWMNVVMMPMWVLSGVFFSSENFPTAMQPFIRALPLTALNEALRGNMIDGTSLGASGPQLLVLSVWMVLGFGIALRIFRWQ